MTGSRFAHFRCRGVILGVILSSAMLLCFILPAAVRAAEVMPPVPDHYFNDYAHVVPQAQAQLFNLELDKFERDTSNQIVVAIYPKMQSDSDIADYTYRVKETWHVGQKLKDNGAVLFVFVQDRKVFIQTNYGLEGALPDAKCKEIIDQDITPRFATGDYTGGLQAGINDILAATRGEYKGNGMTVHDIAANPVGFIFLAMIAGFILFGLVLLYLNFFGGRFYQRHVAGLTFFDNAYLAIIRLGFYAIMFSSGGSSSSGGSRGGGGFSGGGGRGGGGGAGGSW